jgi:hypothetical protein
MTNQSTLGLTPIPVGELTAIEGGSYLPMPPAMPGVWGIRLALKIISWLR